MLPSSSALFSSASLACMSAVRRASSFLRALSCSSARKQASVSRAFESNFFLATQPEERNDDRDRATTTNADLTLGCLLRLAPSAPTGHVRASRALLNTSRSGQ